MLAVEAALFDRYVANGGLTGKATMGQTIPYLEGRKLLPQIRPMGKFPTGYHWALMYRNAVFAHPKVAIAVAAGLSNFEICADLINALYKGLVVKYAYMPGDAP